MTIGRTFIQVATDLSIQLGRNTTAGAQVGYLERMKVLIRRAYEELLDEAEWGHLRFVSKISTAAGEQYYDFPAEAQYAKFYNVKAIVGGHVVDMCRGINTEDYGLYDPDTARSDPPQKWDIRATSNTVSQIEVWPVPAADGQVYFDGQRAVPALVADSDVLRLDDQLVILWVLMEQAEAEGRKNSKTIAAKAFRRLATEKAKHAPMSDWDLSGKSASRGRGPTEVRAIRAE